MRRQQLAAQQPELLACLNEPLVCAVEPFPVNPGIPVGPAGTRAVLTPAVQHIVSFVPAMLEAKQILLVDAPSGGGKSTVGRLVAAAADIQVAKVAVRRNSTQNQFLGQMLRAVDPAADMPRRGWQMEDKIIHRLSVGDTALHLDDAHKLHRAMMEELVSIFEECGHCPILIGGIHVTPVVDSIEELSTRVLERKDLEPAAGVALLQMLAAYHPVYEQMTVEQALRTDHCLGMSAYGAGRWRSWSNLLTKLRERPDRDATPSTDELLIALKRLTKVDMRPLWNAW